MQRKLSLHLFSIHKTAGFTWKGQCPKMLENLPFAMAKLPFAMAKLPTTAAHNKILHNEHIKAKWSSVIHAVWASISAMHVKAEVDAIARSTHLCSCHR
jgi:hypothetical protein